MAEARLTVLRQLLLIPLLTPLLTVLLLAALNPRPAVGLRFLVWSAPALPLGAWVAAAAAAGAGLSATATALALRQGGRVALNQRPEPRRRQPSSPPSAGVGSAGPSRAPGEPAPTVAVPFRVIRKGRSEPVGQAPAPTSTSASAWDSAPASNEGWDQPLSDDWG